MITRKIEGYIAVAGDEVKADCWSDLSEALAFTLKKEQCKVTHSHENEICDKKSSKVRKPA